jgi:hypothetical protein
MVHTDFILVHNIKYISINILLIIDIGLDKWTAQLDSKYCSKGHFSFLDGWELVFPLLPLIKGVMQEKNAMRPRVVLHHTTRTTRLFMHGLCGRCGVAPVSRCMAIMRKSVASVASGVEAERPGDVIVFPSYIKKKSKSGGALNHPKILYCELRSSLKLSSFFVL